MRAKVSILKMDLARQLHVLFFQFVTIEAFKAVDMLLGTELVRQLRGRVANNKHLLFLLVLRGSRRRSSVLWVAREHTSTIMMTLICEVTRQGEGVSCTTHWHLMLG